LRSYGSNRPGWTLAGDEVRGRFVWNEDGGPYNVVVDGRALRWEQLGEALESFEGWGFSLTIEDRADDLRQPGYATTVDIPDHVILPTADDV
jgi:hypothetical protein